MDGWQHRKYLFEKESRESVHPATCKKIVDYHDVFAIGANFSDYLIAITALTAEDSIFMTCYGCAECLNNVNCIRATRKIGCFSI